MIGSADRIRNDLAGLLDSRAIGKLRAGGRGRFDA